MNTLTKVFVVLLLIFSIAFTMMTVQFSVSVPDWKAQAETWQVKARQVDTHNRNLVAAKVALGAQAADDRKTWDQQRQQLSQDLSSTLVDLSDYKGRLAKSETDLSAQSAMNKKLLAELGIAQASAEKAREQRQAMEQRNIYLEKANLDLSEGLNEKVATIIVLDQKARQQDQQINLCKRENDRLARRSRQEGRQFEDSVVMPAPDKVTSRTAPRTAAIRGHVEDLSGNLASISVGSNDGVEVGMTFIIYNDRGFYLGDLEVTEVEPNSSAGNLKFVTSPISVGDTVVDERSYLAQDS